MNPLLFRLLSSPLILSVICCPGKGGRGSPTNPLPKVQNAEGVDGGPNKTVLELVKRCGVDMVVVGPEQPLVDRLVDFLGEEVPEVGVFGPKRMGAELEASKVRLRLCCWVVCVGRVNGKLRCRACWSCWSLWWSVAAMVPFQIGSFAGQSCPRLLQQSRVLGQIQHFLAKMD